MISYDTDEFKKENDELLHTVRSLVMVRNRLPAQVVKEQIACQDPFLMNFHYNQHWTGNRLFIFQLRASNFNISIWR